MKNRYRTVKVGSRGGTFYYEDTETGIRKSLFTKDEEEAERLVHAKNEAERHPAINRQMGMVYLGAANPQLVTRTWTDVMEDIIQDKHGPTLNRWNTAIKDPAFDLLRKKIVVQTTPDEFMVALRRGTVSTNVYLRRLQNHCVDMGWLPVPILPKKKFPKIKHKEKRAIRWEEHSRIIARERNPERRDYYELCWYFGGSQSDIANLQAEDLDYERRCFVYDRLKTGNMGGMRIGAKAWEVILRRPRQGPLFPYLITVREADRATEFKQRCQGLGIEGVTLHSYRYAWAERGADNAYPERYAQRALGQSSKIVHRAYAKKAQGELPSLRNTRRPIARPKRAGRSSWSGARTNCLRWREALNQTRDAADKKRLRMKRTRIQWCHSTVNPVMGCDGCELREPASAIRSRMSSLLSPSTALSETTIRRASTEAVNDRTTSELYRDREMVADFMAGRFGSSSGTKADY